MKQWAAVRMTPTRRRAVLNEDDREILARVMRARREDAFSESQTAQISDLRQPAKTSAKCSEWAADLQRY
jgi:hypothetical protein